MTRPLALAACALALAACQPNTGADDPVVEETQGAPSAALSVAEPFAVAAPAGGTAGVFLTVAGGAEADTLLEARSAAAERVEVHETYDAGDGLRGMREVAAGIPVAAGGTVDLAPGGYHVMLINLAAALAVGDSVGLDLEFARAGTVTVRVPVVSLDAMPRAE